MSIPRDRYAKMLALGVNPHDAIKNRETYEPELIATIVDKLTFAEVKDILIAFFERGFAESSAENIAVQYAIECKGLTE